MKNHVIIFSALLCASNAYSASSFMDFYNQSSNWNSGVIGNGELVIDDEVTVTQDVTLCGNIQITVVEGGQLTNDLHQFSLSDCEDESDELTWYLGSESETTTLNSQQNALVRYLDFGGEDRYIISTNLAGSLLLVDNQVSTLLLPAGLTINGAEFAADGVRFTIGPQKLTLLGRPQEFTYIFAGEETDPTAGIALSYAETATMLGAHVPDSGANPVAATITGTVQPDGTISN